MITPEFLHGLAQRLSQFTVGSCADAAACLGLSLTSSPQGALSAKFFDEPGSTNSAFFYVELELQPPGLTLAQLQPVLGTGRTLPRTGPLAAFNHLFGLEFEGAPSVAYVTATFRANPKQGAAATSVSVRRGSRS